LFAYALNCTKTDIVVILNGYGLPREDFCHLFDTMFAHIYKYIFRESLLNLTEESNSNM